MRMPLHRLLPAMTLAGIALGLVLVALLPSAGAARSAPVAAPVAEGPRPDPHEDEPEVASSRPGLRAPDPGDGAPWAVRRLTLAAQDGDEPARCAQLGRIVDGRLGWIVAGRGFTPAPQRRAGRLAGPCATAERLEEAPAFARIATLADPTTGPARVARTVVWGLAGPDARAVRVEGLAETAVRARLGEGGTYFAVIEGPPADPIGPRVIVETPDGQRSAQTRIELPDELELVEPAGDPRVVMRSPDPAGGPPWGLLAAPAPGGGWCPGAAGRAVGERIGRIDLELGTFSADPLTALLPCRTDRARPTREEPLRITVLRSSVSWEDEAIGEVQLRTLPGRTVLHGTAHPDVESLTLRTPRDVRTLEPSTPGNAFLAVYDGSFPTGTVTATARLTDGTTVTQTVEDTTR
ncbi:MAG: hypothetical protein MSC31_17945 [Solirubrobacteraceae bacterium MAG38_C4-C5]|nr:hypothetical protein [Candidatus Siliceabacter maunaloa]